MKNDLWAEKPNISVGSEVTRMLAGTIPMKLKITSIENNVITCSDWEFDLETGAEIDDYLDWGPPPKSTGSYIKEIVDYNQFIAKWSN